MPSRTLDAEIDRLYQLPLDEFTQARNALAKTAGGDAARVRALPKPPIAAWAANQLYWRNRDVWNALVEAAENARRQNRAALAGRDSDVRAATQVHNEAVERALRATLGLLTNAGHPATDATKQAIATTLRALPADGRPGRLGHALQPLGFEALSGVAVARGPSPRRAGKPARAASEPVSEKASQVDIKALTRAKQAAASASSALRAAEQAARREQFEQARSEREERRAIEAAEQARAAQAHATKLREAATQRAAAAERALAAARSCAEDAVAAVKALEPGSQRKRR